MSEPISQPDTPARAFARQFVQQSAQPFAALFAQARAAAFNWRDATGGKIVGYLGSDVPVEIIAAAGLLPFRVAALPAPLTAVERFLEMGDSDVVAQLANALLDGSYDFLDHLVIGNTPTFNITLFHFLRESRRLDPDLPIPSLSFHELHHNAGAAIEAFNVESCRRLATRLSELGSKVTPVNLQYAIDLTNARRNDIAQLRELRRQQPAQVSGTEALTLFARWQWLPQAALPRPLARTRNLPRVLFSGSDIGHFLHYSLVESAGCTIVADDHDWGDDTLIAPVEAHDDPFVALAHRYTHRAPHAARWSRQERIAAVVQRALDANVEGVVFWISDEDQASSWDAPDLSRALQSHGIATLDLGPQPALDFDAAAIVEQTRAWLDALPKRHEVDA